MHSVVPSLVSSRCSFAIYNAFTITEWVPRGLVRVSPVLTSASVQWRKYSRLRRGTGKDSSSSPKTAVASSLPVSQSQASAIIPSVSTPIVISPDSHQFPLLTESLAHLLSRNGVMKLYHFTDRSNISSIVDQDGERANLSFLQFLAFPWQPNYGDQISRLRKY